MKHTIEAALLLVMLGGCTYAGFAGAAEGETYTEKVDGQMSKVEALYKLIQAKGAGKPEPRIYKCVLVEVSSKGTIKNK